MPNESISPTRGTVARSTRLACVTAVILMSAAGGARADSARPADARPKVAVMPLTAVRVPQDVVTVLDELLLNELYARGQYSIISLSDMNALLGFERVKSIVDCSDLACAADIGGALGVRYLLAGTVAKLGNQMIVTLKLLDTQQQRVDARAEYAVENDEARFAGAIRTAVGRLVAGQAPGATTAAPAPEPTRAGGRLDVTTTPPGATCEVDGKSVGKTPCKLDAPAGSYTLRLTLAQYVAHAEILVVESGKTTQRAIALTPAPVPVRVTSTPSGATVTIDGAVVGKTPLETQVAPGSHELRLAREDYAPKTQTLSVAPAVRPLSVDVLLNELPGRLVVTSTPKGAEVRLGGRPETCTTDCTLTLFPGKYSLRAQREGYEDERQTVSVAAGRDTAVALALTPVTPLSSEQGSRVMRQRLATALTAVTALGVGVFAWQGLRARAADQELASVKAGTAEALAKQDEGRTAAHAADLALAASVLSAAGASYLWVKVAF